ncbi:MAG: hypothetical protein ACFB0D_24600 [Phormidesmis sp.]
MNHIQVLEGPDADTAVGRLNQVVTITSSEDGSPDIALIKRSDAVVAPVMHKGTLTQEIVQKIFDAASTTGQAPMTAVGLYNAEEQHCYSVPMVLEGLNELRGTSCGVINFALFGNSIGSSDGESDTPSWLVLFDDQLYVAYGPKEFVTTLVGDIGEAFQAVETRLNQLYTDAQGDIPGYAREEINRMGEYLDAALTKLTEGYAKADEGDWVGVV